MVTIIGNFGRAIYLLIDIFINGGVLGYSIGQKSEDFIGWKSDDGNLEVIGLAGKDKFGTQLFKIVCKVCSPDTELFPEGYFISVKKGLKEGRKPCMCSGRYSLDEQQSLVVSHRVAENNNFVVHGFSEDFHGMNTKLECECLIDGHKWQASVSNVVNNASSCVKCSRRYKPTDEEVINKCRILCVQSGYKFVGLIDKYENARSRFEYECPEHGKRETSYHNFVNKGRRCRGCANISCGTGNGFYPDRIHEKDYLYVVSFDNSFIKIGRSFNVSKRLGELKDSSKCDNIKILDVYTSNHLNVYEKEQEIHRYLRKLDLAYFQNWTTETFENSSYILVDPLIEKSNFNNVTSMIKSAENHKQFLDNHVEVKDD